MAGPIVATKKPERWDVPFADELELEMSEADIVEIMGDKEKNLPGHAPFNVMDESMFSPNAPLREILRNDARIRFDQDLSRGLREELFRIGLGAAAIEWRSGGDSVEPGCQGLRVCARSLRGSGVPGFRGSGV